ncbi:MAG: branched-chain amino acid transport system permease protein [Rhodospirillaceae bacterium]|nr:branched-chain amino acid transport system permease protein [Rhodospirillaceae bacterium]
MIGLLQNVIDAISLGSLYALAALGIGLLFGVLRLINFAHGDFISVGAYALIVPPLQASADVAAQMFIGRWPLPFMLVATSTIVIALAILCYFVLFRYLKSASPPTLMIASFAASYVIQNALLIVYGAREKSVNLWPGLIQQVDIGALHVAKLQLVTIGVTMILMLLLTAILRLTPLGVQMRAAAEDFRMAQYLGVRSNYVISVAFALSGVLAVAVSLLFVAQTGTLTFQMGVPLMLFAFIGTVIGGMGSLVGAAVGGMTVGIAASLLQAYLPGEIRSFRDAFVFTLVILMLIIRPAGLFPTKAFIERI